MIHTSKQLKDKVRNISKGDNEVAKALIRIFMMERFLERVSLSKYKNNFILKGGMKIERYRCLVIIRKLCLQRKCKQLLQEVLLILGCEIFMMYVELPD